MLKTKMLTDSPVVLLPTYLHSFLTHVGFNAHWRKFCFLFCVTAVKCDDISVCCVRRWKSTELIVSPAVLPACEWWRCWPALFPLLRRKSAGRSPVWSINNVYSKAKEETMPFNTVTRDTSWSLLKVRGRAASLLQVLTHRCPTRLPSLLSLGRQC